MGEKYRPVALMLAAVLVVMAMLASLILFSCSPLLNTAASSVQEENTETAAPGSTAVIQEEESSGETTNGETANEKDAMVLDEMEFLTGEDRAPFELIAFIDANIGSVSEQAAAKLVEELESVQKKFEEKYSSELFQGSSQEKLFNTFQGDLDRSSIDEVEGLNDETLKEKILEIFNGGFKLLALEGSYYAMIDYEYLKKYNEYLPEEFKDYISVMAAESGRVYSRDAALAISLDELGSRLAAAEQYLNSYPEMTIRRVEAATLYMGYLSAFIYGLDNTPNRDYSTNQITEEAKENYIKFAEENSGTKTGLIIKDYLDKLESNGYVLSEEMFPGIKEYFKMQAKEFGLDSEEFLTLKAQNIYYTSELADWGYFELVNGRYDAQPSETAPSGIAAELPEEFIKSGDLDNDGISDAAAILIVNDEYYIHAIINGYSYFYSAASELLGKDIEVKNIEVSNGLIYIDLAAESGEVSIIYQYMDYRLKKIER